MLFVVTHIECSLGRSPHSITFRAGAASMSSASPLRPRVVELPHSPSAWLSPHRSPPTTPKQITVLPLATVSTTNNNTAACRMLIPQLLSRSELTVVASPPHSPHPLLLCSQCLHPLAQHSQQPHATASAMATALQSGKLLHDPIHGHIYVEDDLLCVIDSPHFQRLRDLKQLGTSYFVFPGACHNRFEHSIGVAHLAAQLIDHLIANQPELDITPKERFLVTLAALCHDLGHSSNQHTATDCTPLTAFTPAHCVSAVCALARGCCQATVRSLMCSTVSSSLRPSLLRLRAVGPPGCPLTGTTSRLPIMMTEDMLAAAGRHLDEADMQFVRELIDPTNYATRSNAKLFLYDIVANARNSLDVDKVTHTTPRTVHRAAEQLSVGDTTLAAADDFSLPPLTLASACLFVALALFPSLRSYVACVVCFVV